MSGGQDKAKKKRMHFHNRANCKITIALCTDSDNDHTTGETLDNIMKTLKI